MPTSLGPAEILVILVVALIVLGPNKLPGAARQVGRTLSEVRKWSQGFQDELRNVMDPGDAAPSYPPAAGAAPATPPPGGPATPADSEYTGPTPETAPPYGPGAPAPATGVAAPPSTNGSTPGPVAPEPTEPPAGEPPAS